MVQKKSNAIGVGPTVLSPLSVLVSLWMMGPVSGRQVLLIITMFSHWLSVVNCLLDQSYIGDTCILVGGYSTLDRVAG